MHKNTDISINSRAVKIFPQQIGACEIHFKRHYQSYGIQSSTINTIKLFWLVSRNCLDWVEHLDTNENFTDVYGIQKRHMFNIERKMYKKSPYGQRNGFTRG